MAACNITIVFTAINEIDISAAQSAAQPYFDVYVSQLPFLVILSTKPSPLLFLSGAAFLRPKLDDLMIIRQLSSV